MASRGINKVILVGRLGQDPETRFMPNGNAVTNFTLATSETWKDKNTGENQERTEWHRCTAYGRLAEVISEWVKKGMQLYVEGSLRTRSWEQDGVKRYATEINISEMQMLGDSGGGRRGDGGGSGGGARSGGSAGSGGSTGGGHSSGQKPVPEDSFDDDIPF